MGRAILARCEAQDLRGGRKSQCLYVLGLNEVTVLRPDGMVLAKGVVPVVRLHRGARS
jgi:hypothetical protein